MLFSRMLLVVVVVVVVTPVPLSWCSIFGVSSLVGNVWQYTDEFQDDRTRTVILRGSSNYRFGLRRRTVRPEACSVTCSGIQ